MWMPFVWLGFAATTSSRNGRESKPVGQESALACTLSACRLATCSSDMTLRLFDVQMSYTLKETLRGHEDSVSVGNHVSPLCAGKLLAEVN